MNSKHIKIDENLYNRQLYVFGHKAMQDMSKTNVLISGLDGLGVEIAKNIILMGVNRVLLQDTKITHFNDLATQYYLTEKDLGKNRAQCCCRKLAELNNYVQVTYIKKPLTDRLIKAKKINIVILVNTPLKQQLEINRFTHRTGIRFISASTLGLMGQIFCDFGNNFTIKDIDGERLKTGIIEHISNEEQAIITCVKEKRHGLINNSYVRFSNMPKSMKELNNVPQFKVKYIDNQRFQIDYNTSKLKQYNGQAEYIQVKPPQNIDFKPLKESIDNPDFVMTNFIDFDRPNKLHTIFKNYHKHRPETEEFRKLFDKEFDQDLLQKFIETYRGTTIPINSIIGGIVAQEIIKACSGKYNPIRQWLYFDAYECLDENYNELNKKRTGTRYDGQIKIFGQEFQKRLMSKKFFIVGSGAIGCELLKNIAMMGVGAEKGHIYVTDMDVIEKSNLSRQFLFRSQDIHRPKSDVAVKAVKTMNPKINITPHLNRVGEENEHIYNRKFYQNLDGIINALDNVDARLYMDKKCIENKLPLLESGTLGTKGNVQVIIPNMTESYGSSRDPEEEHIPMCTLKNFPNKIEHTVQWSRDRFEGIFTQQPQDAIKYVENPNIIKTMLETEQKTFLKNVIKMLCHIPKSFDDCIEWAYLQWFNNFRNKIEQLLYNFPPNSKTKEGALFWSGSKKCPEPLKFNSEDTITLNYVLAMANLRAFNFKIKENRNINYVQDYISKLKIPIFKPKTNKKISVTDEEEKSKDFDSLDINELIKTVPKVKNITIVPVKFEKDVDTNFHIDFITCSSNLRARNYKIKEVTRHQAKGIAGKIIPAIATTTAIVGGLVSLELIKLIQGFKKIDKYHDSFINLALPFVNFSEPKEASIIKYKNIDYTLWDSFDFKNSNIKLNEIIDHLKEKYSIDVCTVSYNEILLYDTYIVEQEDNERRLNMKILDILKQDFNVKIDQDIIKLEIDVDEEESINLPQVRIYL